MRAALGHSSRDGLPMNKVLTSEENLTSLAGMSGPMQDVLELIRKVGNSDVPVLIQGESGTGKELVARAIHHLSSRGEFVPIDCGAMPAHLVESELFGHERGAFTGAETSRKGLLETADGGTAFFDEIGDLPREAQAKLLRVLQQKEVRPLGSNRSRPCNFRVIAATNLNLAEEVENRRFRLDLYYRLNVVTLEVPPLRDRKADIPLLVTRFLRKTGRTFAFSPNLMDSLLAHNWPGNVRELKNIIARLVVLSSNSYLDAAALPFWPRSPSAELPSPSQPQPWPQMAGDPLEPTMLAAEHRAICRAMASSSGNATAAAKSLGISRTTLYRWRKDFEHKHALDPAEKAYWGGLEGGKQLCSLSQKCHVDCDQPCAA
jgi:transcriptional regulator with PAS, ATPase and Fis domain